MEKVTFNGELVLTIESHNDWIRKCPRHLPEKRFYNEHFMWIDANGNCLAMGGDFMAAEEMQSYPVKVYRMQYVRDVYKQQNEKECQQQYK